MMVRGNARQSKKRPLFNNKNSQKRHEKRLKCDEEDQERNKIIELIDTKEKLDGKVNFEDYPISSKTKQGLNECKFVKPTSIQLQGIFNGLKEDDIFAIAKTGSGKTLAFLIPILENLWRNKWTHFDNLGALVISPTRELAYQTFHVLRDVGKYHNFSAGLIIGGGKDVEIEKKHLQNMCILICTPGRLLQHMDENPYFDVNHLKLLILDEADKILDMGFQKEMLSILEYLPKDRQTMLYSATQDRKVMDLAKSCLKSQFKFIHTNIDDTYSTPTKLVQSFLTCELHDKTNFIYQFLKAHNKSKLLIFVSCCKQAKYLSECFKKLRVGMPVLELHGGQKQIRRLESFETFSSTNTCALFATDLASRGLDFPSVDWVIQLDCPSDAITYIHRVGRTARLNKDGKGLLVLMPTELKILQQLKSNKIPIYQMYYKYNQLDITKKLQSLCIRDKESMLSAQRCVMAYKKTVSIQSNKKIFQSHLLDYNKYAISLGLSSIDMCLNYNNDENIKIADTTDDNDFLVKCTSPTEYSLANKDGMSFLSMNSIKNQTKIGIAKRLIKKGITVNSKIKFDDNLSDNSDSGNVNEQGLDLMAANKHLKHEDTLDRAVERERIRQKHKTQKEYRKQDTLGISDDNSSID